MTELRACDFVIEDFDTDYQLTEEALLVPGPVV